MDHSWQRPDSARLIQGPTLKSMYYSIGKNGECILSVKVIPNAAEAEIVGVVGDMLKVRVQAQPEKGKANAELVSFLAERFSVPKTSIEIVRGHSSSRKLIRLFGVDEKALSLL